MIPAPAIGEKDPAPRAYALGGTGPETVRSRVGKLQRLRVPPGYFQGERDGEPQEGIGCAYSSTKY